MELQSLQGGRLTAGDPLLNFMFWVQFPAFTELDGSFVQAVSLPDWNIAVVRESQAGEKHTYVGLTSHETMRIVFYEHQRIPVQRGIDKWRRKAYDNTTKTYGVAEAYWYDLTIYLLASGGGTAATCICHNCLPTSIGGYDLKLGMDAVITPDVTFAVESYTFTVG